MATTTPVVEEPVAGVPDPATGRALWWAFALGAAWVYVALRYFTP